MSKEEVEEFLLERINYMNKMSEDLCKSYSLTHISAEFGGFWPLKDIEKNYEICPGNPNFNINSFT